MLPSYFKIENFIKCKEFSSLGPKGLLPLFFITSKYAALESHASRKLPKDHREAD